MLVVAVNSDASTRRGQGPGRPRGPGRGARRDRRRARLRRPRGGLRREDVVPIIRELRPDVHVKGTDYTPETIPEAAEVARYGGRVAVAGDPKDHSTTDLLRRLAPRRRR